MPRLLIKHDVDGWELKVPFAGTKLAIGSGAGNTICLQGEGVAARHCLLFRSDDEFFLRSVAGPGQVRVNDAEVTGDVEVADGSIIAFGPYRIEYCAESNGAKKPRSFRAETRVPAVESHSTRTAPAAAVGEEKSPVEEPEPVDAEAEAELALEPVVREESFEDPLPDAEKPMEPAATPGSGVAARPGLGGGAPAGASSSGPDRRRAPRTAMGNVNLEMKQSGLFSSLSGGSGFPIRLVDLSLSGAKIVSTAPIDKKHDYTVKLQHAKLGAVNATVRIVWQERFEHRTNYGEQMMGVVAGVQFKSEGRKQHELLRDLIERRNKSKESQKVKYR